MRREERNALSKQKILEAALCEFGNNGCEKASLNTVCSAYDISKGNIYHYFKDKDEIYLSCVKSCFDALNNVLEGYLVNENQTILENISDYFDFRFPFFYGTSFLFRHFCGYDESSVSFERKNLECTQII